MHQVPDHHHLMNLTTRPDAVMVRGQGSRLWDEHGRPYLDFVQAWAVNALGHCPHELSDAIVRQVRTLVNAGPGYHNAPQRELSRAIAEASGLSRVFFCNSGAEANEGALKLCRKWGRERRGGAFEVLTTVGGFHGRTLATMAATGKPGWDTMFPPKLEGFPKVPYGDAEAMRASVTPKTAAILVEPIQGEAGVVVPPAGYLRALRAIADEHGLLLVLDEVQTGIGRTGRLFAHQHEAVLPDVMTLGKGLGGGVPLAALVVSERANLFSPGEQGGTFNGNPLMTAAGAAVLRTVGAPAFLAHVAKMGERFAKGLDRLASVAEVRGKGLLVAARLDSARAEAVRDRAFSLGLLVNAVRPDTLRFMPALNVSEAEIDEALALLSKALGS
ncbi:MAG TPA: aminotransferase class III-fold pyridoxal phosphate-dependent enzyme [Polyangiaceae bacterium]|nr:aminotransferase class III-fold pyridoxal phosphate-dependent enzyme [Polyangiaceae bacterium]